MRLSQATVKFLGRMSTTFQGHRHVASIAMAEGAIWCWGINLSVQVTDFQARPETWYSTRPDVLNTLQGIGSEVELVMGAPTEITAKGTTYRTPASLDDKPLFVRDETWAMSYKIDDVEAFTTALRDMVATADKEGRHDVVHLDRGEMLATDGHRVAVRYCGVDGQVRLRRHLAVAWLKMLGSFDRSKGGWWLQISDNTESSNRYVALTFRHFGQEVRVKAFEANEGMTTEALRKAIVRNGAKEEAPSVDYDVRAVRDFCKLFDVLAFYSNGAIVGWVKGEGSYNNGNDGFVPRGEKPLFIASSDLLSGLLPKAGKRGYVAPLRFSFGEKHKPRDKNDNDGVYQVANFGENVLMSFLDTVPELAPDAYETAPAAVKAA